jgi:hypothetical protein
MRIRWAQGVCMPLVWKEDQDPASQHIQDLSANNDSKVTKSSGIFVECCRIQNSGQNSLSESVLVECRKQEEAV